MERGSDPGPPQKKEQEEDDEEEEKESNKRVLRSILARKHPDIRHKPNKKDLDPNTSDFAAKLEKFDERLLRLNDDDDEEIQIPSRSHWKDICLGIWGMKDDKEIINRVKAASTEQDFEIFTDGWYNDNGGSGCGVILQEGCHRPIVAASKVIPREEFVSPFHLQLEGVALGVKLAKKYNTLSFRLYCPSEAVSSFVMQNWISKDECCCAGGDWEKVESRCKDCSKLLMFTGHHEDHDKAFQLSKEIFSDISDLQTIGLRWFDVSEGQSKAAYHVAKLQQDKELNLMEISNSKELWDLIYAEAFALFLE
ncbi:hypothetical protein MKW94_004729 [Papaver nudicaule]|uniref:Uncharacterized protein n=1 Tax=Papaver nudicaule TaxID=74823 RepID=A0AA41VEI0_PAPNU|nr:hypothetical protein [Papaver nudicaule]